MEVFKNSLGLFLIAFVFHLVVWRIRLPVRQTKALLFLFAFVYLINIAFNFFGTTNFNWVIHFQSTVVYWALTLGYIISYSALEADSPSLVLILRIFGWGDQGCPENQIDVLTRNDVLILPRLNDLIRDQMAIIENGRYKLTTKGKRFIRIFIFYRNLLGAKAGG